MSAMVRLRGGYGINEQMFLGGRRMISLMPAILYNGVNPIRIGLPKVLLSSLCLSIILFIIKHINNDNI